MKPGLLILYAIAFVFLNISCYRMRSSNGGGQTKKQEHRIINPADIALPSGFKIEAITTGLNFPTGLTTDSQGNVYVVESGYSYGEDITEPRLLKIGPGGIPAVIATGKKNGPWNGIEFYSGNFYISEGGINEGGKILKISPEGKITSLVENLPSYGDHHVNGPVINNNNIYFTIGTATNSGVVGNDNYKYGWLQRRKGFHDVPCQDVTLSGVNYLTDNIFTVERDEAVTGPYLPYNTKALKGQVIKGKTPCGGAVFSLPLEGGEPKLVAWGLRNPFGIGWAGGKLYVAENGFDERGSRPVWGAGDAFWEINEGTWYGWPDFSAGKSIVNDEEFKSPGGSKVEATLLNYPNLPPKPAGILGVHSASCGFDFSTNQNFGYVGQAFIAQFGDMAPEVGKVLFPVGFKIVRLNVDGSIEDFAANKGKRNGPASWLKKGGLERPVDAEFSRDGSALYIVDFGILRVTKSGSEPVKNTGVIWKITKK